MTGLHIIWLSDADTAVKILISTIQDGGQLPSKNRKFVISHDDATGLSSVSAVRHLEFLN